MAKALVSFPIQNGHFLQLCDFTTGWLYTTTYLGRSFIFHKPEILEDFPQFHHDSREGEQLGRYNFPIYIYNYIYIYVNIKGS